MKKALVFLLCAALSAALAACGPQSGPAGTLVYGSGDYTRINPAMDEHGELNLLLFNGLTAHNGDNQPVPALAESWDFDPQTCTYTFHLRQGVKWHDGQDFTAGDVKFTIEAIMDPDNGSENAPNYEDVEEITVADDHTVSFRLSAPNAAFLDYMSMPVLPRHCLEGEDMQESDFFRAPIGTGPYRLAGWEEGQSITLARNEDYFLEPAQIDAIVFKIVPDDSARALQLRSGELDLAQLTPKDAEGFEGLAGYQVFDMATADYRGILFNFHHAYWQENRDLIPAVCCAMDRQAMVNAVLHGQGKAAYGPLQCSPYHFDGAERWEYDPQRAREILEQAGCVLGENGYYQRGGQEVGFVLSVGAGDQVRLDLAQAAAQMLGEVGVRCTVEVPEQVDWAGQMAYLIGWGSPFDPDDHTYKVFGTGKGANYSGYSNPQVDEYLTQARQTSDPGARAQAYAEFQKALAQDPAFAFLCYIDAEYAAKSSLKGIAPDTVMGHHGVGIFWNVTQWTLEDGQ